MSNLFESASIELEEFVFDLLLKIMRASHDLGMHGAPDGRAARSARHDRASFEFVKLVSIVMIYLEAHPELEPKASENFANIIRPDILELLGLPKGCAFEDTAVPQRSREGASFGEEKKFHSIERNPIPRCRPSPFRCILAA
jgi:hypothetical protein